MKSRHTCTYNHSVVCIILRALFRYDVLNSFYEIFHMYYFRCIISYVLSYIDSDIVNIDYTTDTKDIDQKEDVDDKPGEDHVVRNHIYIYRYTMNRFLVFRMALPIKLQLFLQGWVILI